MGILKLLLLALLIGLQYLLWSGKNGVHDLMKVRSDVAAQESNNNKLKVRNDRLFAEINDLNSGQEAIEERARDELGMIRQGESFYRLTSDKPESGLNSFETQ